MNVREAIVQLRHIANMTRTEPVSANAANIIQNHAYRAITYLETYLEMHLETAHPKRIPKDVEAGALFVLAVADQISGGIAKLAHWSSSPASTVGRHAISLTVYTNDLGEIPAVSDDVEHDTIEHIHAMSLTKRYEHAERMATKWAAMYEDLNNAMRAPGSNAAPAMRGHLELRLRIRNTAKNLLARVERNKQTIASDSSMRREVEADAKTLAEAVLLYLVGDTK